MKALSIFALAIVIVLTTWLLVSSISWMTHDESFKVVCSWAGVIIPTAILSIIALICFGIDLDNEY